MKLRAPKYYRARSFASRELAAACACFAVASMNTTLASAQPVASPPVDVKPSAGASVSTRVDERPHTVNPEALPAGSAESKSGLGGNFMDTRLTWTFGDDDVFHRTGTTVPISPLPNIGDRSQYRLFFDNLNSRFSGRENLAHLAMYRRMPGFITNLDTEAALVLRFDMQALAAQNGNVNQALYDAGSYLRLFYKTGGTDKQKEGVSLVFFPLDTDRFRIGYLYEISWGGTALARKESIFPNLQGSSPGMKVQYDGSHGFYLFGGFKTAQILQVQTNLRPGSTTGNEVEQVRVVETNYGFLGGGGADLGDLLHFDISGGYFQQGRFEQTDLLPPPGNDVQAPHVFTYGASSRLVFHQGMPTPQSVDFQLYRNDPNAPMRLFAPEKYSPNELAYSVALEASRLYQNLHDPVNVGGTTLQPATAVAMQGVVKAGYARAGLAAIYRDLAFIERNAPGFVPFEALDPKAKTQSEMFFAGSLDYYIPSLRLRPGIGAGIQFPATFSTTMNEGNAQVKHVLVVRKQGDSSILPQDEGRKPVIQARLSAKWDLSDIMAAIGWVQVIRDPNATLVTVHPAEGTALLRTFQSPNAYGFGLTLQARY